LATCFPACKSVGMREVQMGGLRDFLNLPGCLREKASLKASLANSGKNREAMLRSCRQDGAVQRDCDDAVGEGHRIEVTS